MISSTIIINQPFGMGDYIFCNSIGNMFVDQGYNVIWPVESVYAPIAKHFKSIAIVDKALININYSLPMDFSTSGTRIIPLRFADSLCRVPYTDCMKSKYMYFGMDWKDWKSKCRITRDMPNEFKLFFDILGLKEGEQYNLISEQFTTGGLKSNPIIVNNGLRNISMGFIPGFTLIDWLTVMQNATYIFAVASSNIYVFELFPMKAEKIHLYIRRPNEQNHKNYEYILEKPIYVLEP
jgi:hypothetical protein